MIIQSQTLCLNFLLSGMILAQTSRAAVPPVSVFNGTNLDGWVKMNDGSFTVTNNVLHVEGGKGWLRTEREFGDFVLDAEWRGLTTNYNSGFFIRAPLNGNPWATNVWQINTKQSAIGELLLGSKKIVTDTAPPVAVGEWVKFHAEAHGTNLTLDVNDRRAWEFHALEPVRGYIGLQAEGRPTEFRNVRIRELPAPQN